MKLRLFRSLVGRQRIPRASSVAFARFDGIEISLSQLEDSPSILSECAENSLRVVCLLNGIADASDAEAQLHRLSSQLSSRPPDAAAAMELAVLEAPELDDLESVLGYLNDIQPVWSEFLEAHTTVGSRHGKLNAHGNPLYHHVLGICHSLSLGTAELAEAVDTYSPTRLALTASNLGLSAQTPGGAPASAAASTGASQPAAFDGLGDELDSVLEAADLICADADAAQGEPGLLWALFDEVWAAQQLAGATEVYAACRARGDGGGGGGGGASEEASDELALRLAAALRGRFEASAEWRAGAADRRSAQAAAHAARRRCAPESVVGSAARAFRLSAAELEGVDKAGLKRRFKQLALQAHPDVAGGSEERFLELRAAYQVLLRATRVY